MRHNRLRMTVLTLLLVLGALVTPVTALAAKPEHAHAQTFQQTVEIAWDATSRVKVHAGRVHLTIEPGTFKEIDGTYQLSLTVTQQGKEFVADIDMYPEHDGTFLQPVAAKFGNAKQVENDGVIYETRNGLLMLEHFSRYSGWF